MHGTQTSSVSELGYYISEKDGQSFDFILSCSLLGEQGRNSLPVGFPESLQSPLVWEGISMERQEEDWVIRLSSSDIIAIEAALQLLEARGVSPEHISTQTFLLPDELKNKLQLLSVACYDGRGFCVLRGLDPIKYSTEQNSMIFMGLSAHVGSVRGFQDRKREQILCHVVNAAVNLDKEQVTQPGFTDRAMSFHNDEGEILALFIKDTAENGGKTCISSAWLVYNLLAEHRPDIISLLAEEWTQDTFQDYSMFPPKIMPFLHVASGRVFFNFSRYPFTGYGDYLKRNPTLPPVTAAQMEALDAVQILAERNSFPLPSRRGDILYLNNMALLHGREPFDENGNNLQRHLIKLELRDPRRSWDIPEGLLPLWGELYGPNRDDGRREEYCSLKYELGQEREWSKNG